MASKRVEPGDRIVAVGGRTGRDGIHGATFSSVELTGDSEEVSGGAVQIGNAITEKMVLDVLLQARDRGLFRSITDCGAGGFSSAVGEMGAELGAEVDLERAPLKYEGLSYTEIWISEAQERMVLAVPPEHWPELEALCASRGRRGDRPRPVRRHRPADAPLSRAQVVGDLSMDFLHDGRPTVVRAGHASRPPPETPVAPARPRHDYTADLLALLRPLGRRQQGMDRPPVRPRGPGPHGHQAARRRRRRRARRRRGDPAGARLDARAWRSPAGSTRATASSTPTRWPACVIDEAVRNCVAVGADPDRIALLDNFCWGNPERPETLGSLVLAAAGLPRPGARVRHAVHLGQGQPLQRVHPRAAGAWRSRRPC